MSEAKLNSNAINSRASQEKISNSFPGSSGENKVAFHVFIHYVAGALRRLVSINFTNFVSFSLNAYW